MASSSSTAASSRRSASGTPLDRLPSVRKSSQCVRAISTLFGST